MWKLGKYRKEFNDILGTSIEEKDIYCSKGLETHMRKRNHISSLKYISNLPEIINSPDYIGVNPNEKGISVEFVKEYDEHVIVGIKLDQDKDCFYVATMYDIQKSKVDRRLYSGRLKIVH